MRCYSSGRFGGSHSTLSKRPKDTSSPPISPESSYINESNFCNTQLQSARCCTMGNISSVYRKWKINQNRISEGKTPAALECWLSFIPRTVSLLVLILNSGYILERTACLHIRPDLFLTSQYAVYLGWIKFVAELSLKASLYTQLNKIWNQRKS